MHRNSYFLNTVTTKKRKNEFVDGRHGFAYIVGGGGVLLFPKLVRPTVIVTVECTPFVE